MSVKPARRKGLGKMVRDYHAKHPQADTRQVADALGCSVAYVRAVRRRHGVSIPACKLGRPCGSRVARLGIFVLIFWLHAMHPTANTREIAEMADCGLPTVRRARKLYGLPIPSAPRGERRSPE